MGSPTEGGWGGLDRVRPTPSKDKHAPLRRAIRVLEKGGNGIPKPGVEFNGTE